MRTGLTVFLLLSTLVTGAPLGQMGSQDELEQRSRYARLLQRKLLLEREAHLKELQLHLAEEDAPYLVFDLEKREVRIYVRVTPVQHLPLTGAEMEVLAQEEDAATPRQEWIDQALDLVAKSGDQTEAEVIQPPSGGADSAAEINPRSVTAESAGLTDTNYPSRYTLLFRQGVAVHILGGQTALGEGGWVQEKLERLASLLITPELPAAEEMEPVHTWIHLTMSEEQARAIYPMTFVGMRAMVRLPGDPVF
jgi:hypothetical protein